MAIACIYCSHKEQGKQTVPALVASLLKQLVQDHPAVSGWVKSLYAKHYARDTHPSLGELMETLRKEVGRYSRVFIIVDALDEFFEHGRGHLITELQSLANTVNLMVTSRRLPSIEQIFQGAKHKDIYANERDVRTYIENRILQEPSLLCVVGEGALQKTIADKIIENVRGMYVSNFLC